MTVGAAVILNELELDALMELVNLGVSNAALSLREMVREEVILSVPKVCVVSDHSVTQAIRYNSEFNCTTPALIWKCFLRTLL